MIDQSKLTAAGRLFLLHAKTLHGAALSEIDHRMFDDGDGGMEFDDLTNPIVRVRSSLSWGERTRKYGIDALASRSDWTGEWAENHGQRHMIPTDDYISRVEACYAGHIENDRTVTLEPYLKMEVHAAINKAGQDLEDLVLRGDFWIDGCDPCPCCGLPIPMRSMMASAAGKKTSEAKRATAKANASKPRPNAIGKKKPRGKNE